MNLASGGLPAPGLQPAQNLATPQNFNQNTFMQ